MRRSVVLNDPLVFMNQSVLRKGTACEVRIHSFEDPSSECPICRENPRQYPGNLIPARILTAYVVDLNHRPLKARPSGIVVADRLGGSKTARSRRTRRLPHNANRAGRGYQFHRLIGSKPVPGQLGN